MEKKERKKLKAKIFIDGANIFYTQKKLGWFLDWKKIIKILTEDNNILETRYYTGIKEKDQKMEGFLSYLKHLGIKILTKPLKIIRDEKGNIVHKSNCDLEMAVDILLDSKNFDNLILFTGDSDFVYLIKILQKRFGKKCFVYSSRKTISWELRLEADDSFFLEDLKTRIQR